LEDRTFACLLSFLKANDVKVVALKDAPDYVEHEIRVYTQADLDALLAACTADERAGRSAAFVFLISWREG
jgi:hypothetical protein